MMKIRIGIASTTHIDKHGEKITREVLEDMAQQVNTKFIPQLIEHDWNQQIGVILYSKVFKLNDGEYALGFVSGIFENKLEKNKYILGEDNNVFDLYKEYFDEERLISLNKKNISKGIIKEEYSDSISHLLAIHLDSTQLSPNGGVYKIKRAIAYINDLKIEVYPGDHDNPKHFHVVSKSRKINARFSLKNLDYINAKYGEITNKDIKKIKNFFETHLDKLDKLKREHKRLIS